MTWNFYIPMFLFVIVILHEMGHLISAKLMRLTVEKVGFSVKPVPRLYVSVIDNNIPLKKRLIYLLSGSMMTLILFTFFCTFVKYPQSLYYAFAYQIIVETNPFYSDYVVALISGLSRKEIRRFFYKKKHAPHIETKDVIQEATSNYMYSGIWYIHFILWAIIIVLLLAPNYLIKLVL